MEGRRDTPEQAEFREYCRRWLAGEPAGGAVVPLPEHAIEVMTEEQRVYLCAWQKKCLRRRPGRLRLPEGVRRRRPSGLPAHRQLGDVGRRRALPDQRHRPRHGRADDPASRHRGAEAPLPAAAALRRGDLVPGVLGAQRRQRSRQRADLGGARRRQLDHQRPQGVDQPGALRQLDDPAGAPQQRRQVQRPHLLHRPDRRRARASRCGR